jgi:phosphoribosyl-AMP cyclohydrolase
VKNKKTSTWGLEEGDNLLLDFKKLQQIAAKIPGVIPVAVQDIDTREVILIAYTNKESFEKSVKTGIATFWSTSRNEMWIKGETSGNTYELKEVYVNCEQNSLLYVVKPKSGGICHTYNAKGKARNCFYRRLNPKTGKLENINP